MESKYNKPVLLFDGDCGFCKRWIKKWENITGDSVLYLPYQNNLQDFPQVKESDCKTAVQYISPSGNVYSAGEAVLKTLSTSNKYAILYKAYQQSYLVEWIIEAGYAFIARNRGRL